MKIGNKLTISRFVKKSKIKKMEIFSSLSFGKGHSKSKWDSSLLVNLYSLKILSENNFNDLIIPNIEY